MKFHGLGMDRDASGVDRRQAAAHAMISVEFPIKKLSSVAGRKFLKHSSHLSTQRLESLHVLAGTDALDELVLLWQGCCTTQVFYLGPRQLPCPWYFQQEKSMLW